MPAAVLPPPPGVCAWEGIRLVLRPLAIAIGMLAAMIPVHAAAHSLDRTSDGSTMRLSKKDDEAIMSHPMELLAHPPLTTHCGFNHQNLNGSNLSVAAAPYACDRRSLATPRPRTSTWHANPNPCPPWSFGTGAGL